MRASDLMGVGVPAEVAKEMTRATLDATTATTAATARTAIGLGTGDSPTFTTVTLTTPLAPGSGGLGVSHAPATLAALGSVQGDAAAIVSGYTFVTAADATKGVILPATPTVGAQYFIVNTANAVLKIYPGTGDNFNGLSANSSISIAAYGVVSCKAQSTSVWDAFETAVVT